MQRTVPEGVQQTAIRGVWGALETSEGQSIKGG